MSHFESFHIVGGKFRPPALALLDTLKAGTELVARREPSNAHDANAIMILVLAKDIVTSDAMRLRVENFGKSLEEIVAAPEWHLGYVPRERAASLAPVMDKAGQRELVGQLTFSASGQACVRLEVPDGQSS